MNFRRMHYYHLSIKTNSKNDFFIREDKDFDFFANRYLQYLNPFVRTLCYCLLPQSYESIIYIGDGRRLIKNRDNRKIRNNQITEIISNSIRKFHISYCKYFNHKYHRIGSLFREDPKAIELENLSCAIKHMGEIHLRTVKLGLIEKIGEWKFSSYRSYAENIGDNILWKERILGYFGSIEEFINFHKDGMQN